MISIKKQEKENIKVEKQEVLSKLDHSANLPVIWKTRNKKEIE